MDDYRVAAAAAAARISFARAVLIILKVFGAVHCGGFPRGPLTILLLLLLFAIQFVEQFVLVLIERVCELTHYTLRDIFC